MRGPDKESKGGSLKREKKKEMQDNNFKRERQMIKSGAIVRIGQLT